MLVRITYGMALPLMVAGGMLLGQTKPNFNGTWKMNPAKSDYSAGPVAESRLDKLTIEGVNFKDTITTKLRRSDETTYDMIYTLDGQECTNHVNGRKVTARAHWDGNDLVIDSKVHAIVGADIEDRWSLAPDGKSITLKRHMTGAVTADQTVFFERQ